MPVRGHQFESIVSKLRFSDNQLNCTMQKVVYSMMLFITIQLKVMNDASYDGDDHNYKAHFIQKSIFVET